MKWRVPCLCADCKILIAPILFKFSHSILIGWPYRGFLETFLEVSVDRVIYRDYTSGLWRSPLRCHRSCRLNTVSRQHWGISQWSPVTSLQFHIFHARERIRTWNLRRRLAVATENCRATIRTNHWTSRSSLAQLPAGGCEKCFEQGLRLRPEFQHFMRLTGRKN